MATRCEVCGQYPIQGTIRTFFPWPADISQRAYWQTCLGIQDLDLSKPELFICSDHFDQLQMIRKGSTLRKDAFPKRYEGPLPTFPQGGEVPPEPPKMEPSLETPCPDVKNEDGIFGTSGPPAPLFDDEEIMPEELSMAKLLLLFTAAAKERPSGITPLVTPVAEETKAFSNILIDRQQKYLDSYCKSCLRQAELVNMMEANCEGVPVLLMYKSVFMTELDLSEIPQLMCHTCIGLLFQCFKFTTMTLRSCEVLRAARERFKYLPPLDDSDIDLKNIPEKYSATPAPIAAVIESDEDDKQEVKKVVRKRKATVKVKLSAPPKKKGRPARRASVKSKKVNKKILDSDVSSSESENFDNDEADPDFEDAAAIKDESPESSDVEPELEEKEEPEDEGDEEKVEEDENYCMLCRHKFSNMARHMDKVHRVDWENKSCERCEWQTTVKLELFDHIQTQHKTIKKCLTCEKEFDDKSALEEHFEGSTCTGKKLKRERKIGIPKQKAPRERKQKYIIPEVRRGEKFICNQCKYETISFKKMFDHLGASHSEETNCILCEMTFENRFQMLVHLKRHGKFMYCSHHFLAFDSRVKYFAHYKSPDHDLECGICFQRFDNKDLKNIHWRSVHLKKNYTENHFNKYYKDKGYKCPHCPNAYNYYNSLYRHIKSIHQKKVYLCEDCGASYTTSEALSRHVSKGHKKALPDKVSYQCEVCGFTTNHLTKFKMHKIKHFGFFCDYCLDPFDTPEKLKHHEENTNHEWFYCDRCPQKYKTDRTLNIHIDRVHENPDGKKGPGPGGRGKPRKRPGEYKWPRLENGSYFCKVCHKEFRVLSNVKKHQELHSDMPKYKCHCGKSFWQEQGLKAHYAVHSDKRPHVCIICWKSFKDKSSFYKHRKIHGWVPTIRGGGRPKDVVNYHPQIDD